MRIRAIEDGDETAVAALWERCALTRPWNDPSADIRFARQTETSEIFVAMDGDRLVASVMCGHDGHRGWVYYLAVDPACQGRRLGRALMTHAEDWLRGLGVPKVELMIRDTNAGVAKFYNALGYKTEPVITMSRWLRQPEDSRDGR